jgi:HTH-type transcriptional regulator/antitoxin HigA
VRLCPLRIIRTEEEYDHAIAMINYLVDRGDDRASEEVEYLLALAVFVEKYEDEHDPIPAASGVDLLRSMIEARQITQADVAAGTGLTNSTISEILAGKRKLNRKHIEALARFFKVKAAVFLDD